MRMGTILKTAVLALVLAAGSALGQGVKIGFVNSQEVLYRTNEGSQGLQQLEAYMTQKRTEFDGKQRELADLQQEFQTKRPTLAVDAAADMQRRINQKQVELQRYQEDIQTDLNDRQNGLLEAISQKVQQVIEEYAQKNGLDAVFIRDQSQAYVAPALDVTADIIQLYNQKFPGGSGSSN